MNDAANPVYFDLLTVTRPQDQALVSQENHYYPLGLPMSGVAVNTVPAEKISKQQFNGGSELQDELLGAEGGVYSTFFRTYDPATGRFTGVDPLADATADWTPYQFALGNPIAANDPTGAFTQAQFHMILDWFEKDFQDNGGSSTGNIAGYTWSAGTGVSAIYSNGSGGFSTVGEVARMDMMSDGHGSYIQVASGWTNRVETSWSPPAATNFDMINNYNTYALGSALGAYSALEIGSKSNLLQNTLLSQGSKLERAFGIAGEANSLGYASVRTGQVLGTVAKYGGWASAGITVALAFKELYDGKADAHTVVNLAVAGFGVVASVGLVTVSSPVLLGVSAVYLGYEYLGGEKVVDSLFGKNSSLWTSPTK